ncbi:MAG: hypothetical protein U0992_11715 [Planctomycetaceae bacterium]
MKLLNYEGTCAEPYVDPATLKAMFKFVTEARALIPGRVRSDLDSDRQWNLEIVQILECIGRAAAATPSGIKQQYSDLPWSRIQRWSPELLERYDATDNDTLWDDVQTTLPALEVELSCIVGDGLRDGITRSLIRSHPHPSGPACVYAWEWFLEGREEGLSKLPVGLRHLVAIQDFDGGIFNGGFGGHLGNRTNDATDQLDESINAALKALRALKLTESLDIATRAIDDWIAKLLEWRTMMNQGEPPDIGAYDTVANLLGDRWHKQQRRMYANIDAYIKAHPDEFVHP